MSINTKLDKTTLGKMQRMPQEILEEVFSYLSYEQVSQMGRECRSFREAARSILYRAIGKILTRIDEDISKIDAISKFQLQVPPPHGSLFDQIQLAALMTILKMCASELRIINACCARYMRDREFDFCFPAGDILDDFEDVVRTVRSQTKDADQRVDGDVTTSLFIKTGHFLDFFDASLETLIAREVPVGVTVLDILGCAQASDFVLELSHPANSDAFQLQGSYELHDTGTVDRPPELDEYPAPVQAKLLVRYLRNYVRWNNLFDSLHKLWDLEEAACDVNNNISEKILENSPVYDNLLGKNNGYHRENVSENEEVCCDIFRQKNSTLDSELGIKLKFKLCSQELPMSLESLRGGHIKVKESWNSIGKVRKDACIQTELTYVTSDDSEWGDASVQGGRNSDKEVGEVDPDRVLDYVQSVKKSLSFVRGAVDRLTEPSNKNSQTLYIDKYSSVDSLRGGKGSNELITNLLPDSTTSFPYQCSMVSIHGVDYSMPKEMSRPVTPLDKFAPSHMSVVYHCSIQSLPRDSQKKFIDKMNMKSICEKSSLLAANNSLDSMVSDRSSCVMSSLSAYKLSQRKSIAMKKHLVKPPTANGLVDNCILLEKLSNRCLSLAKYTEDSIVNNESVSESDQGGSDENMLANSSSPKRELSQERTSEGVDVEMRENRLEGNDKKGPAKGQGKRQNAVAEVGKGVRFAMQMKIHYLSEDCSIRDKMVTVDCAGKNVVIAAT